MTRFISLRGMLAMLAVAVVVLGATAPLQAADDYTSRSWLSPKDPQIGETYELIIRVTNHSNRWILFRPRIDSLPRGDVLLGTRSLQASVPPGATQEFRFTTRCGVLGGTVRHSMSALWD
jgi:hypothetical protein